MFKESLYHSRIWEREGRLSCFCLATVRDRGGNSHLNLGLKSACASGWRVKVLDWVEYMVGVMLAVIFGINPKSLRDIAGKRYFLLNK